MSASHRLHVCWDFWAIHRQFNDAVIQDQHHYPFNMRNNVHIVSEVEIQYTIGGRTISFVKEVLVRWIKDSTCACWWCVIPESIWFPGHPTLGKLKSSKRSTLVCCSSQVRTFILDRQSSNLLIWFGESSWQDMCFI